MMVLFAIVLLAALASAGFFAALQEVRAGYNAQGTVRARGAAEAAVWSVVAQWDPRALDALAIGGVAATASPSMAGMSISAGVRRLTERLFLIRASAVAPGGASSSVVTVVRLLSPETAPAAARTRQIGPGLAGFSSGVNGPPPGWNCPAASDTVAGVMLQSGAADSTFLRFGAMNWAMLAAWAGAVQPGGDSLVVRYEPGDATMAGGRTMGLVVVEGDLTLSSGAWHAGLILVRGTLRLDGAGGTVIGAVVASQIVAVNGYTALLPAVLYSSCTVDRAAGSRALPVSLDGQPAGGFF